MLLNKRAQIILILETIAAYIRVQKIRMIRVVVVLAAEHNADDLIHNGK